MKRILRHVGGKDFKKTHQRKLDEQRALYLERREKEIQEQQRIEEIKRLSSPFKSDWRSEIDSNKMDEINEGMTTSGLIAVTLNPTDAPLTTLDGGNTASFNNDNGGPNLGSDNDGLSGCAVVSSGTGSGSNGGFNLGQNYLAFNQSSFDDGDEAGTQNLRFAVMAPMDASRATTLEVTAIVGNGSNGGDAPESGEDIVLAYASGANAFTTIQDDQGNDIVVVPYNGSGSLRTYSVTIPADYRIPNISFILRSRQNTLSLSTQDNYGITEIKLKRTVPASVFVGLDDPEATNFIRTDPIMRGLSAEGRRKKLEDMLNAGDEYLLKQLGMQGSIARPADTGNIVSWQQAASGITPITGTGGITRIGGTGTTRTNTSRTSSSKSKSTSIFGNPSSRSRTFGSFGGRAFGTTSSRFGSSQSISSTAVSQQLYKNDLKAAGYSDKQIAQKTNVRYIAAKKNTDTAKAKYDALLAKASTSKTPVDLTKAKQDYEDASRREFAAMMGGQSTVAQRQQSYDKLQSAIKAGTDNALSTLRNPITPPASPPVPPRSQPQSKLTPQQLANIDASLKQLQLDNEKLKADANRRNWEFVGNLAMDALTLATLFSPIPGDEALVIGARTASQTAKMARNFQRQNPGKYNPFLSDKANKLARQQGVGTNVKGQNPAFRKPLKNSYEPQGQVISEKKLKSPKEVLNNKIPGYYDGKPAPLGFPDNPPPEMVNGMHPDLVDGKKVADRFNRLDPQSAQAMPPTGNPHIDKKVLKARKQPK